jgi:hypothetical protein
VRPRRDGAFCERAFQRITDRNEVLRHFIQQDFAAGRRREVNSAHAT